MLESINERIIAESRKAVKRLVEQNDLERVARAMKATQDALIGLPKHQPPDHVALNRTFLDLGIKYDNDQLHGATVAQICIISLGVERETGRWRRAFSEWGLEPPTPPTV